MKHLLVVAAIAACHASPRPALSAEQRVSASLARWGTALEADDQRAQTTDGAGQFALVYGATKLAASHVDGGAQAVEMTIMGLAIHMLFTDPWEPGTWHAVVPTGALGPTLVAAGLAARLEPDGPAFAVVPISSQQTLGRLYEHEVAHRRELRARRAWTCRLEQIERSIPASEPIFVRAAAVSTNIFKDWLDDIEGIWLVRARCASGPALFAITARKDGNDRVLLAKLMTSPG